MTYLHPNRQLLMCLFILDFFRQKFGPPFFWKSNILDPRLLLCAAVGGGEELKMKKKYIFKGGGTNY